MLDIILNTRVVLHEDVYGRRSYELIRDMGDGHRETKTYRRVAGGAAWPARGQPGFLCVLGEDMQVDLENDVRHVHRLGEAGEWDGLAFMTCEPMFEAMSSLSSRLGVNPWHCLPCPDLEALSIFNRSRSTEKRSSLRLRHPRNADFQAFMSVIYRRTTQQKTLHLHEGSIAVRLSRLPRDVSQETFADHPQITSLAMAVHGLERTSPDAPARSRQRVADRIGGY